MHIDLQDIFKAYKNILFCIRKAKKKNSTFIIKIIIFF